jgi:cytochrome P450
MSNLLSADFKSNPYPAYSRLRSNGPIHWADDFFGGAWLLPRYTDVKATLRDPRLSAARSYTFVDQFGPKAQSELAEFNRIFAMWLLFLDNPQHRRLRKLMNTGFTPAMILSMRSRIQKIVDALLDRIAGAEQFDFMQDFAYPLPALVIAEMLGVDAADQTDFIAWSDDVAAFFSNSQATLEHARRAQNSLIAMTEYFRGVLLERRDKLGNDLISLLIRAEEEGDVLTIEELVAQCSLLLFAGHETTRYLLGNGLLLLLQHPDQLERLKDDPALMKNAVQEFLRYDSPVQFIIRIATNDFTLHGQPIKAGQKIVPLNGSANHDPLKFPNPDTLDIRRKTSGHLAFGYGAHTCLGATLSSLEAEIVFNTILHRLPHLHLIKKSPDWRSDVGFRGLKTLPLAFSASSSVERRRDY